MRHTDAKNTRFLSVLQLVTYRASNANADYKQVAVSYGSHTTPSVRHEYQRTGFINKCDSDWIGSTQNQSTISRIGT